MNTDQAPVPMKYRIRLVRNQNRIGLYDLNSWLSKYASGTYDTDLDEGMIYNAIGLSEAQLVMPVAGYDVVIIETTPLNQESLSST